MLGSQTQTHHMEDEHGRDAEEKCVTYYISSPCRECWSDLCCFAGQWIGFVGSVAILFDVGRTGRVGTPGIALFITLDNYW